MSNENELLEPLATEAGQQAIARAINNLGSLENAVRAERAAATATQKADEARNSADDASDYATEARNWATKTDGYVAQETITIPPEQEGDEPTTETIDLYSAKYYAALAQDIYNNLQFDSVPTENSTALVSSGAIYTALNSKADKSDTYTKTEVDTALSGKADQSTTYTKTEVDTALSNVQSTLTFDSTPTANSNNPVTSGGIYTALQNVNIDIDDEITEDSDNPVTSAAIYEALQNFTPSGGGSGGAGNASGVVREELWGNINGWNSDTITLNTSWKDYDILEFIGARPSESPTSNNPYITENYLIVAQIKTQSIKYLLQNYDDRYMTISFTNDTTLTAGNNRDFKIYNIYGIKFSKNLSEQMYSNVLYENSSGANSGTITLNDNFDNYDFISFEVWDGQNGNSKNQCYYSKEFLQQCKDDNKYIISIRYGDSYIYYKFTNFNTITIGDNSSGCKIYKIVGIKLAKGGYSGIVSDARMTVKSGTVTLDQTVSNGNHYAMSVAFDSPMPDANYVVCLTRVNDLAGGAQSNVRVNETDKTVNGFKITFYANGYQTSSGMKYDWVAIRPNSYTREGMVEDVLFSNANGVNSGTINLSGNISDYDLISFETNGLRDGNDHRVTVQTYSSACLIELIGKTYPNGGYIYLHGHDNQHSDWIIVSDSSLSSANNSNLSITKITGIKFGRYVSGVAVDTTVTQNSNAVVTSGAVYDALQNYTPSGGGSSITVDSTITQGGTNPVEGGAIYTALDGKADKSTTYTKTEVDTALGSKQGTLTFDTAPTQNSSNPVTSGGVYTALQNLPTGTGDVTTNTDQNITGTKTFVGSKKVAFKQSTTNDKLGFTLFGNTGTERGYLEFNPTNTVDGVTGLMTLGNYATSAAGLTQVGFRRYSNISGASGAYNLLMPMVADARTPFNLTTSYQNFYLPLGFTDGTTTVKTAKSGVVDLSPIIQNIIASANNVSNANGVSY